MTTATVTSKGQITIPADVRRTLGVQTGDRVEFVEVQPGRFELVAATRTRYTLQRQDERAGTVHVHFPRIGYALKALKA